MGYVCSGNEYLDCLWKRSHRNLSQGENNWLPIVLKILHGLVSDTTGVGSVPPWADVGSQMRTITEYAPADTPGMSS